MRDEAIHFRRVSLLVLCLVFSFWEVRAQGPATGTSTFGIPATAPIQLADAALKLSDEDLAAVRQVLGEGKAPWLIYSDASGPVGYLPPARPPITVYLPPDSVTAALIRGHSVGLHQIAPQNWVAAGSYEYAQVVPEGKTPEQIPWNERFYRPFALSGSFNDDEILSIVRFMQNGTRTIGPVSIPLASSRPIRLIERLNDERVRVNLGDVDWSAQVFILRRMEETWVVEQTFSIVA